MNSKNEVESVIKNLIQEWDTSARKINRGSCAMFAMDVADKLPSIMIRKTGNVPVSGVVSADDVEEPAHIWVTDGKIHYDAEVPSGVKNWRELPVFVRARDNS